MNDFDKAARFGARMLDPEGFFRWLLGAEFFGAWQWLDWLDTQSIPFPGEADRRLDVVASFRRRAADAPPVAVVVEFLSQPRRAVLERLTEYTLRVRRELPYQRDPWVPYDVVGVLVHLTGASNAEGWSMQPANCRGLGLWAKCEVVNLQQSDAAAVLAAIAAGTTPRCVLPWISLMKGAAEAAVIAEWKRLTELDPDQEQRGTFAHLAQVFAELVGTSQVWKKELEGWNMERSKLALEWERKGRDEGRNEGRIEAVRAKLLRALQLRLRQPVPADVSKAIEAQGDQPTLDHWFDLAFAVNSVDELRQALGINGTN